MADRVGPDESVRAQDFRRQDHHQSAVVLDNGNKSEPRREKEMERLSGGGECGKQRRRKVEEVEKGGELQRRWS